MSHIIMRPLDGWTDPPGDHEYHQFKSSWTSTTALLRREVDMIGARVDTEIVLQVQTTDYWLRKDGGIRAEAKVTGDGVIVSFDSAHGPLRYACDQFTGRWGTPGWQANVRAIALGLEALRKVDRYGVSKRGEQYTGFTALPAGRAMGAAMTFEGARLILAGYRNADDPPTVPAETLYKRAAKATHPDVGGDAEEFRRIREAYELVTA